MICWLCDTLEGFSDLVWKTSYHLVTLFVIFILIYRIFHDAPETRDRYFTRVRGDNIYSPEFRAHAARVAAGFDMSLSMLDDVEVLNAQLAHLKAQHLTLDVEAKYLDVSILYQNLVYISGPSTCNKQGLTVMRKGTRVLLHCKSNAKRGGTVDNTNLSGPAFKLWPPLEVGKVSTMFLHLVQIFE